jgi:hypothetical protein
MDTIERLDESRNAEHCGKLEAEAYHLRLRRLESREREDRLSRLVAERPDLAATPMPPSTGSDSALVERLQREVALLAEYQRAVVHSRGWRFVQLLRRPFGRAW